MHHILIHVNLLSVFIVFPIGQSLKKMANIQCIYILLCSTFEYHYIYIYIKSKEGNVFMYFLICIKMNFNKIKLYI